MTKKLLIVLLIGAIFHNCSSSKSKASANTGGKIPVSKERSTAAPNQAIVKSALNYEGVKYKYGGSSKKGMDCSGLIYASFTENNISIPRSTSQLKSYGDWVDLKEVQSGDLVFFATKKNSRKVNHVGIVTKVMNGDLRFIHASTSQGVIESLLSERYWYFAFVQARRVL